jgi:hypothetical protein
MIILGYYLIRSFLREYTYDAPPLQNTIKTNAIFWSMRNPISSKYIGRSGLFNNRSNTVERKRKWIT